MSKLVKQLMMDNLQSRLQDVGDVFVVSLGQLDAQKTTDLRLTLRKKNISLQLIKNALAKRVLAETPLAPALENLSGMLALCWEVKTLSIWQRNLIALPNSLISSRSSAVAVQWTARSLSPTI